MRQLWFIALIAMTSAFGYHVQPTSWQGTWKIEQVNAKDLVMTVDSNTSLNFDTLTLERNETLHISQPDGAELVLAVSGPCQVQGKMTTNGSLKFQCKDTLILGQEALIDAKSVHFHSDQAPQIHAKMQAKTINICCEKGQLDLRDSKITGVLTIDPKYVLVQAGGTGAATGNTFVSDPDERVTIDGGDLSSSLDTASVIIQANTDITINDEITASTSGNGLTLQAGRSIVFMESASITLNAGNLSCTINDENADASNRDSGPAICQFSDGCEIQLQGGNFTVGVGTYDSVQDGRIIMAGTTLASGGGNIIMTGHAEQLIYPDGIDILNSHLSTTGTGFITLNGTGANDGMTCQGINLYAFTGEQMRVTAEDGDITMIATGRGTQMRGDTMNSGFTISNATVECTGNGNIILNGTGGNGYNRNYGLMIGENAIVSTVDGNIDVTGTGGGEEMRNFGVRLERSGSVTSTGLGNVTLIGVGNGTTMENYGISFDGEDTGVFVVDGDVDIQGTGAGAGDKNDGIMIENGACIESFGSGGIDLTGTGSTSGVTNNLGISLKDKGSHVSAAQGNISLTGTGHGTGNDNQGICIAHEAFVQSSDTGSITLLGTGGTGPVNNNGVRVVFDAEVEGVDGNITITGISGVAGTDGIMLPDPNDVFTTGLGSVILNSIEP